MAFDIEAAKADGYTDAEIQQYLAAKDQPIAQEQPHERGDEALGVVASSLPEAAKIGLEGAGALYAGKKIIDAVRGPVAPSSPAGINPAAGTYKVAGTGSTPPTYNAPLANEPVLNETWDKALRQPTKQAPSMVERGTQYAREMQRIAAEKVMQGARAAAPYAAPVANAARAVAPAAAGIVGAITPSNIGQNYPVPQTGPYRGMEINPNTGRPWTQQELAMMR